MNEPSASRNLTSRPRNSTGASGNLTPWPHERQGRGMSRITCALLLSLVAILPTLASAEDGADNARWAQSVRGSGTYQKGLAEVRGLVEDAYDNGALRGASHWEAVHEYYLDLARLKGCERGKPHAKGPVKECIQITTREPKLVGSDYREGMAEVDKVAEKTAYPDVVRRILVVLYDFGYLQGLKHGVRVHNEDIRLAQTYSRSCMERANDSSGERACATASKQWADGLLKSIRKRIEAHSLASKQDAK